MKDPIGEKLLMAYADGELAGERRHAIEQYLADHPEARQLVENYRVLSRAAQRTVRQDTPPVPRELRAAIEGMIASEPVPPARQRPAPVPNTVTSAHGERSRAWLPLTAAAVLLLVIGLASWIVLRQSESNSPPMVKSMPATAPPTPADRPGTFSASLAADVWRVHEKCARLADHFISPEFGRSLQEIPAQAERFLGDSAAPVIPNLGALGYKFNGAGPCSIPGGRTLHLLYRHQTDAHDHVSVFIQSDQGQLNVAPDKLHGGVGHNPQHPILVLRRGGLIYYITADAPTDAEKTATLLSPRL